MSNTPGLLAALAVALGFKSSACQAAIAVCSITRSASEAAISGLIGTPGMLPSLAKAMQRDQASAIAASAVVCAICQNGAQCAKRQVAETQGMLPALVKALSLEKSAQAAAEAVVNITWEADEGVRQQVADARDMLQALSDALQMRAAAETAAEALCSLCHHPAPSDIFRRLAETPGLLQGMAAALKISHGDKSMEAAWRLLSLVLGNLAGDSHYKRRVVHTPGMLTALVVALGEEGHCRFAALALSSLLTDCSGELRNALISTPGSLSSFVIAVRLAESADSATLALAYLCRSADHKISNQIEGNQIGRCIVQTPDLLLALVEAVHGDGAAASNAVMAVYELLRSRDAAVVNQVVETPGIMHALAAALRREPVAPDAADALLRICNVSGHVRRRMAENKVLLESLMAAEQFPDAADVARSVLHKICKP